MREKRSPDGGHYLPMRHPQFDQAEMNALLDKTSGQCIAEILNLQFHTKLTGADIDLCIGKNALRLEPLAHRILLAQCWHTPGYAFERIRAALAKRIAAEEASPGGWLEIGIRIAVLFGVFSDLHKSGVERADVA